MNNNCVIVVFEHYIEKVCTSGFAQGFVYLDSKTYAPQEEEAVSINRRGQL